MKLTFSKDVIDARVTVTVSTGSFTQNEQNNIANLGEPEVDLGGEFYLPPSATPIPLPSTPTASPLPPILPVYVHSNLMRKISADFNDPRKPLSVIFDGKTLGVEKAIADANVWIDTMKLRFEEAMVALRARANDFKASESMDI